MKKLHIINDARARFLEGVGVPPKSEFKVDDFQAKAIANLAAGIDTLVVAPTGSGKTFIAIEGMRQAIQQKGRAVYTTPLKALSNTKYAEFQQTFGPEHTVGLLTGDRKIEGNADIVIATTEIYRNNLYRGLDTYSLVILDEVHYIADPQRGPVWEESIILTPSASTLLMLSASISNATEIAEWIAEVRGKDCDIVIKKERPVELRYGFLHPEFGVIPLEDEKGRIMQSVNEFYGSMQIDESGMRLKSRRGFRGHSDRGGRKNFKRKGRR